MANKEAYLALSSKKGSFSNYDGDGNESVKTAIGLLCKTTSLHVRHPFCTCICRYCTTTTRKCLISRFMEDALNKRRRNFVLILFLNLSAPPPPPPLKTSTLGKIAQQWTFSANWKFEKKFIRFKSVVLAALAVVNGRTP